MIAVPIDVVLNNGVKAIIREYNTKDKILTPSHAYKRNVARVSRALENKKPVRVWLVFLLYEMPGLNLQ